MHSVDVTSLPLISSPSNPRIRKIRRLLSGGGRGIRREKQFVILWWREFWRAIAMGWTPIWIGIPDRPPQSRDEERNRNHLFQLREKRNFSLVRVDSSLFEKVAPGEGTELLALFPWQEPSPDILQDFLQEQPPALIVLDQLEKPGNVGAIFRTADALGFRKIALTKGTVHPLGIHALRSSTGAVFGISWSYVEPETLSYLFRTTQATLYLLTPAGKVSLEEVSWKFPLVIIAGREHEGLPAEKWLQIAGAHQTISIRIPMDARVVDSLNVSVAVALCLYEVHRQWKTS